MAYGRGYCRGTKKERKGSTDWYKAIEQANIDRITKEWAEREVAKPQVGTK
jgi:hypothetical protein